MLTSTKIKLLSIPIEPGGGVREAKVGAIGSHPGGEPVGRRLVQVGVQTKSLKTGRRLDGRQFDNSSGLDGLSR